MRGIQMKWLQCFALLLFISNVWALDVKTHAEAYILMDAKTRRILAEKNMHTRYSPASITKIATAIYSIKQEGDNLEKEVIGTQEMIGSISAEARKQANYRTPPHWIEIGGTHMVLKKGEKLKLKDLLHGMMLISANDASNAIAITVSGSVPQFMADLNAFLGEIGCHDTHFANPHGLYHPDHYTTPYDMALMMAYAMEDPIFRSVISTVKYERPKTNKQEATWMVNHDKMIRKTKYYYP